MPDPINIDVQAAGKALEESRQWLTQEAADLAEEEKQTEQQAATDDKYAAEQQDPRNKDQWGVGGVVKELQSAFLGGIQDTASSIVTAPERIADLATGEMVRESKTEAGYQAEWDDWFADPSNPIETKTWWGGLIRGATHFGTLGGLIAATAPVTATGAAAVGITGAIRGIPLGAKALTFGAKALTNPWARAAAVGAASDLTSIYSQDANALQILRDRYGFIDTPLTTNDEDHPTVKTFKNVVEGMGIGELANGIFRVIGKAKKVVLPNNGADLDIRIKELETELQTAPTKEAEEAIAADLDDVIRLRDNLREGGVDFNEDATLKGEARDQNIRDQKSDMADYEIDERGTEFGASKDDEFAQSDQRGIVSTASIDDVWKQYDELKTKPGGYDGSTDAPFTARELRNQAKSARMVEDVYEKLLRQFMSAPRVAAEKARARELGIPLSKLWERNMNTLRGIVEGRNITDVSIEEWNKLLFSKEHNFKDVNGEVIEYMDPDKVALTDTIIGSMARQIRDQAIANREMQNVLDLTDVDGGGVKLTEKILTLIGHSQRTKYIVGRKLKELDQAVNIDEVLYGNKPYIDDGVEKVSSVLDKESLIREVDARVEKSRLAHQVAMKYAGKQANGDLYQAYFEAASMMKELNHVEDFDKFWRQKFSRLGGGKENPNLLIKELQGVMIYSILSGPKTPMRAIMGTGSATFLRPLATALGATFDPRINDGTTARAALASLNAMRESVPEAWKVFKARLDSYWTGDVATIKTRYTDLSRSDEAWSLYRDFIENPAYEKSLGDRAAFIFANFARGLNDSKFLNYSTKLMAATDDTFSYLLARSKAREKAFREALGNANPGKSTTIDAKVLRDAEDRFLGQIIDPDGSLNLESVIGRTVDWSRKEVTLTADLEGFARNLNTAFDAAPWAKPFFLFAKTGVNGLQLTAKHTPGFNYLVKDWNEIAQATPQSILDGSLKKYGIETTEELLNAKALQTGRLLMGGSIITMAGIHFMNGGLTGNGPTDRQKRRVWMDAGWIPRSINIGGVWVGYDAFEPFNQILAAVGDIGDHTELMGEEWTEDQFQKLALVVAQGAVSKSYLTGLQQFVDLFAGTPGQQNRIVANLLNNQIPLAGLRNDLGKIFTPHMKELNSGWSDSIRNRNLLSEKIAAKPLPVKYDMLNGQPIRDYDFVTRMWNAVIPIPLNLDQSPGRKLLFDSGYDLRLSTFYGPDGTDLTNHAELRSKFQYFIGQQNLEKELNKLADNPRVQASLQAMYNDLNTGRRRMEPMKAYLHNKLIRQLFDKARKKAWAQMRQDNEVIQLIEQQKEFDLEQQRSLYETSKVQSVLNLPVK